MHLHMSRSFNSLATKIEVLKFGHLYWIGQLTLMVVHEIICTQFVTETWKCHKICSSIVIYDVMDWVQPKNQFLGWECLQLSTFFGRGGGRGGGGADLKHILWQREGLENIRCCFNGLFHVRKCDFCLQIFGTHMW